MKTLQINKTVLAISTLVLQAFAAPITTVPWNGHTGAVSYTYDDARGSQVPTLINDLDGMGIKATFFICLKNCGSTFETNKNAFVQAAVSGHELGNHTKDHTTPSSAAIVKDMADYLRSQNSVVEAVTFAYPNCSLTGQSNVATENFIGRSCGGNTYSWSSQPQDWMNIQGFIVTSTNVQSNTQDNLQTALDKINGVKNNNSWVTMIVHGINSEDGYSITQSNNKKLLEAGKSNDLWIDTYQNIAAYYRAHFVMDAVNPQPTGAGWSMNWTSPHGKMPKSVKLRVKLDQNTFGASYSVSQNGVTIPKESDGSYIIDFMKLSLNVQVSSTVIKNTETRSTTQRYKVYDLLGKLVANGSH